MLSWDPGVTKTTQGAQRSGLHTQFAACPTVERSKLFIQIFVYSVTPSGAVTFSWIDLKDLTVSFRGVTSRHDVMFTVLFFAVG